MHQQISFKYPKIKITICLCVFVLFNYSNCQSQIKFDIEKWIADDGIDSLQINSYRAYIVDNGTFWELAKGKSKKQIQNRTQSELIYHKNQTPKILLELLRKKLNLKQPQKLSKE